MRDEVRRVEASAWAEAVASAVADGFAHLDWLTALDEVGREDALRVVLRLGRDADATDAVRLETLVDRDGGVMASVAHLLPGASWHEREAHDFLGVRFAGGDDRPLLRRTHDGPPPLRKDAVLGARAVRPWPGAKEPGDATAAGRRRMVPPGVPDPEIWGARAGEAAPADEVAASVAGGRVRRRR